VALTAPDEPHAGTVIGFLKILDEAERLGYGVVRTAPRSVLFDFAEHGIRGQDATHPDVFFVVTARQHTMARQTVEARPDLAIEVLSPTTLRDDLPGGRKFAIYERYGVPYYWVADPYARTVTQFTWRDGHFDPPVVLHEADTLTCPLFPALRWPVARVFAGIVDTGEDDTSA